MTYMEFIIGVENNIAKANCNKLNIGEYEKKQKQIYKQIRAEVIDSINDNIHEIYKCQFYCMADMCEHDSPTVDMCIDCFYDAIQKSLERLKEQNNDK